MTHLDKITESQIEEYIKQGSAIIRADNGGKSGRLGQLKEDQEKFIRYMKMKSFRLPNSFLAAAFFGISGSPFLKKNE